MKQKLFLAFALVCLTAQGVWAQAVNYIYYTQETTWRVKKHTDGSQATYKTISRGQRELRDGWYVVDNNVTIDTKHRLDCYGDVSIILKDGCTLTVPKGIRVSTNCTLKIYAQSENEATMGGIHAEGGGEDWAAIGGHKDYVGGTLIIHGGNIYAEAKNNNAAGIGGGNGEKSGMKEILIYGGKVTAIAKNNGAGIGAGKRNNTVGEIYIYGGDITANGGKYGAGIGGSEDRGGWNFYIFGGTVTATGGFNGAGIGGGYEGDGGFCFIHGGIVTAKGGDNAAGIGGGKYANGGSVMVTNGDVTANGGKFAAGIGGGNGENRNLFSSSVKGHGGTIHTLGGHIVAQTAIGMGAAIGGGYKGNGGTITFEGGSIEVITKEYTSGGKLHKTAAIGAGYDGNAGSIAIIESASVYVKNKEEKGIACLFGSAEKKDKGTFTLADHMRVVTTDMIATESERKSLCLSEQEQIRIFVCPHNNVRYEILTSILHRKYCLNCKYAFSEVHDIIGNTNQCVCGYQEGSHHFYNLQLYRTTSASADGYATSDYMIPWRQYFVLPTCSEIPEGYKFEGWLESTEKPASIEASDNEYLRAPGYIFQVFSDMTFFARYSIVYTDTWEWTDDYSNAKVTIMNGSSLVAELDDVTITTTRTEPTATTTGSITYTATATYRRTDINKVYTFTDTKTVPLFYNLDLNESDNTAAIAATNGNTVTVTLSGRTLYKNGEWNTLSLPFDLEDGDDTDALPFTGTPLEGASVKGLESVDFESENGKLILNFYNATSIKAGRAYLVKWDSGNDLTSTDLVFPGVTIVSNIDEETCDTDDGKSVTFRSTYKELNFPKENRSILYLGSGNTLYYPESNVSIGAQRAYFQLTGIEAGNRPSSPSALRFVLNFGDDNSTTGIIAPPVASESTEGPAATGWYDLQGRKLNDKPTTDGLYIHNGKKVIVRSAADSSILSK